MRSEGAMLNSAGTSRFNWSSEILKIYQNFTRCIPKVEKNPREGSLEGTGACARRSWCRTGRERSHVQGDGAMSKCTEDKGSQVSYS